MKVNKTCEKIGLRNTREQDLEFVLSAENAPENSSFVYQWTREQHLNTFMNEDMLHLIIFENGTDKPVGYAILAGLKDKNRNIELRRIVVTEKGKGYGRESIKLMKSLFFEELQTHRLWLDHFSSNENAHKLYISESFKEEGILRECITVNGKYESLVIMSILDREYKK